MIELGAFALLRPWWLLALPALALFVYGTKPSDNALVSWQRAVDRPLLAAMIARGGVSGGANVWSPAILALVFGILALSGPAIRSTDQARLRNLDATLLVMDLSQDVANGAGLRAAATAAHDILDQGTARQAGLILYAGDAYVASTMTDDTNAIDPLLFALDDKTVPDPGVRPDKALGLARKMLREAHIIQGEIVLVSGGGGIEGDAAIKMAGSLRADGHRVDTMFVADEGLDKASETRRLAALSALASAGGGLAATAATPGPIVDVVSHRAIANLSTSAIASIGWRDLGRLLLIAAACPLLLGFRRVIP